MALSRADIITQKKKQLQTYSDFTNNFIKHPVTNQLVTLNNEDSIRQAFKNLIMTNIGERPFNPFFGSGINNSLFELDTPFLIEDLNNAINLSASQFERRVKVLTVAFNDHPDSNNIEVNIVFSIINQSDPLNLNIVLQRVR